MKHTTKRRVPFEEGLRLRIGALLSEREILEEEIRQLRAAVHVYTEVVRRLEAGASRQAA